MNKIYPTRKEVLCLINENAGASLPAQLFNLPAITLSEDALSIYGYGPTVFTSNGKTVYDFMLPMDFSSIPLIDRVVPFGNLRYVSVWATVNPDFSITYELDISEAIFVFGPITPPLPLGDTNAAGAVRVYNVGFINTGVPDLTIGVDTGDVWNIINFPNIGQAVGITSNPIIYWNAADNEFRNRQSYQGTNGGNSSENPVLMDYFDGVTIPHDTAIYMFATTVDGDNLFVPETAQAATIMAGVEIFNDTGFPLTIDANDLSNLNDPLVDIQCTQLINDGYIGTWTTSQLNASGIVLFDGYIAYLDSQYQIRRNGSWDVLGGGGNGHTFTAQTGYDFSGYTSAIIPVRINPFNEVMPASEVVAVPTAVTPIPLNDVKWTLQAQVNPTTMINVAVSSAPDVYGCVLRYDPDKCTYANIIGATSQIPTTNLDITKKPTFAKVDWNIYAFGYQTTGGGARISLVKFNGEFLEMLRDEEVFASDVSDFKVFTGNTTGQRNPYKQITFAGGNTNIVAFFTGHMKVNHNWEFVAPVIDTYPALNAPAVWTNFEIDGCGFGVGTTGALLMFRTGDLHYLDITPGAATVVASNTWLIPNTNCFKVKTIDSPFSAVERWTIATVLPTLDGFWGIAYFDGVNLNVNVPTSFATSNPNRITSAYSIDLYASNPDGRAIIHTVLNNGVTVQIEQTIVEFSGTTPGMPIATGTINTSMDTAGPFQIDTAKLRIQPQQDNEIVLAVAYANSAANFETKLLAYNKSSLLQQIKTLPKRDEIIGVINVNAGLGDTVTVYKNGAEFNATGSPGLPYYVSYNGEGISPQRASTLQIGMIDANSKFQVDIRPPSIITDNELDIVYAISTINPYTTTLLDNNYAWNNPINIKNTTIQSLYMTNGNDTGYRLASLLNVGIREQYLPWVKGDVITVQQNKDYANRGWNVLYNNSEGDWVSQNVGSTQFFDNNELQIQVQLKTANKFVISPMGAITIDAIYGLDIGTEFLLRTNGADVTLNLNVAGSGAGKIISNSWRPSILLVGPNVNTYLRMKVLDNYEIQLIEYVSAGEIVDLDEPATITVSVPSSDILVINSSPKELLPVPGAGKAYEIYKVTGSLQYNTTPYASNLQMAVVYGTNIYSAGVYVNTNMLGNTGSIIRQFTPNAGIIETNAGIYLTTNTGNPTSGDSDLEITITYKLIDL